MQHVEYLNLFWNGNPRREAEQLFYRHTAHITIKWLLIYLSGLSDQHSYRSLRVWCAARAPLTCLATL